MIKYYTGIGSRETPEEVMGAMTEIARKLSGKGYTLRSGGATGADTAFENGAKYKQIFLPWSPFNSRHEDGIDYIVPPLNLEMVQEFHPNPDRLKGGALKLMSRNSYQVLGPALDSPVNFVICWTKDGKASGGTGQACRVAMEYDIPVYNLKNVSDREQLLKEVLL